MVWEGNRKLNETKLSQKEPNSEYQLEKKQKQLTICQKVKKISLKSILKEMKGGGKTKKVKESKVSQ